jgi:hypothetical protein
MTGCAAVTDRGAFVRFERECLAEIFDAPNIALTM